MASKSTYLMKFLYSNTIVLLSLILVFSSCEKFLEEEPPTFIFTESFYQTEADARAACDAVYSAVMFGTGGQIYSRWWPGIDVGTDDMTSRENRTTYNAWFTHTINGDDQWLNAYGQYSSWWGGIGRANAVIQNVSQMENIDETVKNSIVGEARALRGFIYYQLTRAYGDLPIILEPVVEKDDYALPRSSVDEVYDQVIIPDLLFAEENCVDALHYGRVTKWTAKVILADVYLNRAGWRRTSQGQFVKGDASNYTLAKNKAKEIIESSPHTLNMTPIVDGENITPAYGVAWRESAPFTQEAMFELSAVNVAGFGSWLSRECATLRTGVNYWGAGGSKPLEDEGIDKTVNEMMFPGSSGTGVPAIGLYIPTPDLYDAFEDGDERREWSFLTRYITATGENYLFQPTFRKYVDIDFYLGAPNTSFQNTNNNFIVYRYADALLIYAEAANEADGGPSGEAYAAVNEIRNRAGLADLSGLGQNEFREAVWNERRCEFNGECKRKFDLVRTNRLATETQGILVEWTPDQGSVDTYSVINPLYTGNVPWPDNEWLMPIPNPEIALNKDNGWVQNAGY